MHRRIAAFGVIGLFLSVAPAAEPDWPQFRGPNRDDVSKETGLLKSWPKNGPPLLWKVDKLGDGYSSVAVAGEHIFTIGNKDRKSHLLCLSRKDGKQQWTAEVGQAGGDLGCTPTVDGDRVYALGQYGDLVCVGVGKGDVIWRKNLIKDFKGSHGGWRYTESPLIDGDHLICTPGARDAMLVALDKKTGDVVWKCKTDLQQVTAGYSSVVIANVGGIKMYVQLAGGGIIGVDARTGKQLWKNERQRGNTANIPTPVVLGDKIFYSVGYRDHSNSGGSLLSLTVEDGEVKVKEDYFNKALVNKHGGIVVVDGKVYGDTDDGGGPFCADVKTGEVIWKKKGRSEGGGSASVTYADGRLYFLYQNGVMVLVEAGGKEYKEVGSFKVSGGGNAWAHPVVVGGKLYLRRGDVLACYDVKEN